MTDLERIEAVLKDYRVIFEGIAEGSRQYSLGGLAVIESIEKAIKRIKEESK